jgi:hypothetical protein
VVEIQTPLAPVIHPKMILAAAVFFAWRSVSAGVRQPPFWPQKRRGKKCGKAYYPTESGMDIAEYCLR